MKDSGVSMPGRQERLHVIGWALVVSVLWAAIEFMGSLLRGNPSMYQTVWVRYATHLAIMLVVLAPRHKTAMVRTGRLLPQLGRGLLMFGMPVCFIIGVRYLPVNDVWSVFWLSPLLAMVLGVLILRERPAWLAWLATGAAFAGVLVILQPTPAALAPASILPVGMALCFAMYLIASRLLCDEKIVTGLFYTALGALIPLSAGLPGFWAPLTARNLAVMAMIGLFGLLLLYGIEKALVAAPTELFAPFLLATPFWLSILEQLRHYRAITAPWTLAGGGIIFVALTGLLLYHARSSSAGAPHHRTGVPVTKELS